MLAEVTTALTGVIGWMGSVVTALVGESGELAPLLELFAIGIAISAFFAAVKAIRSIVWGA